LLIWIAASLPASKVGNFSRLWPFAFFAFWKGLNQPFIAIRDKAEDENLDNKNPKAAQCRFNMNALPKKKKNLRRIRILIRDSVPSSVVCERLKKARKERVQELILRRQTVDAALAGALQDLLISQDSWDYIEWNASSHIVLRLLKTLSSPSSKVVHRLVIIQPTDGIVTWLGSNTFQVSGDDDGFSVVTICDSFGWTHQGLF
jgi:hypothetical protein